MGFDLSQAAGELRRIPNQLTCLRILLTVLLYWLVAGDRAIFLAVFLFAGFTDILDGYFARRLNQQSAFGLWFDAMADRVLILSSAWWLWRLHSEVFTEHAALWGLLACCLLIPHLVCYARLGRTAAFHLYTGKAAYVIAFVWYLWTIWAGYDPLLHRLLVASLILKSLEATALCLWVDNPYADLRPSIFLYGRK